jgi:hypothetical protein
MLLISHNRKDNKMAYIVIKHTNYENITPSVSIEDNEVYDLETAQAVKKVCELKNTNKDTTYHLLNVAYANLGKQDSNTEVVKSDNNFDYNQDKQLSWAF